MPDLPVPAATAAPGEHADWLEFQALVSADRNSSMQDLVSALRRIGSGEEIEDEREIEDAEDVTLDRGGETIEPVAADAFQEIEDRAISCGGAYPFRVLDGALQGRSNIRDSLYAFLLLLSHYGKDAGPEGLNVPQLFEEVAEHAIGNCLGGPGNEVATYQFGFPRRLNPAGFRDAVDDLCQRIGEGGASKARPTRKDQKDAALDLIAWKPFPDGRRGLVMTWGQCATGKDWTSKLAELQPENWAAMWMTERPAVVPLRSFFVPHRVDRDRWDVSAISAGVLFDRCRIAAVGGTLPRHLRDGTRAYSRNVLGSEG